MPIGNANRPTLELVVAWMLAAALVIWMLSLPAWPSLDSPVHLYYVHVLGALLSHNGSRLTGFYAIKHLLPPYALYYYALLLLTRVVTPLTADKLMVCGYLLLFLSGVHRLASVLAGQNRRAADRALLLATLLALNWPLGMGFLNYCLSVALALWALAVWFGRSPGEGHGRSIRYVLLVLLVTLAHPVPLLVVLLICAADWFRCWLEGSDPRENMRSGLTWLAGSGCLLYVFAFTDKHPLAQRTLTGESHLQRALHQSLGYVAGRDVVVLFGKALPVLLYRVALPSTLFLALGVAWWTAWPAWRRRQFVAADLFLAAAVCLLLVLPWMPSDLSGAYFFPERLKLLVWIFALLATARSVPLPALFPAGFTSWVLVASETLAVGAMLWGADAGLRPVAQEAVRWQNAALLRPAETVLALESEHVPDAAPIAPSWNPYYWMAVHGIRKADGVLVNAPWLDSAILPLATTAAMPKIPVAAQVMNSPSAMEEALRNDGELRRRTLGSVDAVIFSRSEQESGVPALLGNGWQCVATSDAGERVCHRD